MPSSSSSRLSGSSGLARSPSCASACESKSSQFSKSYADAAGARISTATTSKVPAHSICRSVMAARLSPGGMGLSVNHPDRAA